MFYSLATYMPEIVPEILFFHSSALLRPISISEVIGPWGSEAGSGGVRGFIAGFTDQLRFAQGISVCLPAQWCDSQYRRLGGGGRLYFQNNESSIYLQFLCMYFSNKTAVFLLSEARIVMAAHGACVNDSKIGKYVSLFSVGIHPGRLSCITLTLIRSQDPYWVRPS